jgi:hypothetical protein
VSQTPNFRVPLVYTDRDRLGLITREWLPYLTQAANAASTGDLSALQAALDALQAEINAVEANAVTLEARITALEALAAAGDEFEWDGGVASLRAERMQDLDRLSAIEQGILV